MPRERWNDGPEKRYSELEIRLVEVATKLEGHEKTCTERYETIGRTLISHDEKFGTIFWAILGAAGTVIMTLGSALGYIAFHLHG